MIEAKWVHKAYLNDLKPARLEALYVPVVPLSALREVVEGLKAALNLLKYYADKADDPACSYVEREIQSLLASLGEVGNG